MPAVARQPRQRPRTEPTASVNGQNGVRTVRLSEPSDRPVELKRLTVEQYHRMIDAGILVSGEPYELIDGLIVRKDRSAAGEDPMTVGFGHVLVVQRLTDLNPKLKRLGCYMRAQMPVALPPYDEPEPDGVIALGTAEDYRDRHPGARDVLCAIEVSDSSLRGDRTTKLRIYANSGINQYVIVNLPERVIEVYTQPVVGKGRYAQSTTLSPRQRVEFPAGRGKRLSVPVRSLLP
jgi:Uma2 family endonuclease